MYALQWRPGGVAAFDFNGDLDTGWQFDLLANANPPESVRALMLGNPVGDLWVGGAFTTGTGSRENLDRLPEP